MYTRIDCASRPEDGDLATASSDVHALADTDLDPDSAPDINPAPDLDPDSAADRNINPAPDLNAAAADSIGHRCRGFGCQAGVAIGRSGR